MKKRFFPFIFDFIVSVFLFIGIPFVLLSTRSVSLNLNGSNGMLILLTSVLLYFYFLSSYFIPGIYAVIDLVTKNYVTEKMNYVECFITDNKFYGLSREKKRLGISSMKIELLESFHIRVVLTGNNGKKIFRMTQFHSMEKGKSYLIQYAKLSKIIIDISSSDEK